MPRKARVTAPGTFVHIMAHAIETRDLFLDDEDRFRFLYLLDQGITRTGYRCFAWVLMTNHYHLLVRCNEQPLGELMRRLNATYAIYYARKYDRRGYLFQDRFKSLVTHDQLYVENILRYIHANPIRAGICSSLRELDTYPWSGHAVLMGNRPCSFQDTRAMLRRFGKNIAEARRGYRRFVNEGLTDEPEDEPALTAALQQCGADAVDMHNAGCWVVGDPEFVRNALAADASRRVRLAKYEAEGIGLEDIARALGHVTGITVERLRRPSRGTPISEARKVFAYICRRTYGFTVKDIGTYLGISLPPASVSIAQGEELAKEKRYLNVITNLRP